MPDDVAQISELARERQAAIKHRDAMAEALKGAVEVMEAARKDGFIISFNLGPDNIGRNQVQHLCVSKVF